MSKQDVNKRFQAPHGCVGGSALVQRLLQLILLLTPENEAICCIQLLGMHPSEPDSRPPLCMRGRDLKLLF